MNLSPIKSFDYKVDVSSFKNKFIDVDNSLWTEEIKLNIIKLMWLGKKTELYKKVLIIFFLLNLQRYYI